MISSIDGSGSGQIASGGREKMRQVREDVMDAVASKLGESADALKAELAGGKSLSDVAAAKGLSKEDLQSTVEAVVKKDMPNASADQIANLTSRVLQAHGHHHHGHAAAQAPVSAPTASPTTDGSTHVIA